MLPMTTLIATRTLQFIATLVRGKENHPPQMLLSAWCPHPRKVGGQIITSRKTIVGYLKLLLSDINGMYIDDSGRFKDWYFAAEDKSFWNQAIAYLKDPSLPRPEPPANTTHDQNRRSTRNRSKPDRFGSNNTGTGRPEQSPPQPRRRQRQQPPRQEDQGMGYDISEVGEDED